MTDKSWQSAQRPIEVDRKAGKNAASTLFGYDVYISFALGRPPRGTQRYASDLARRLRELDLAVFFCELEMPAGDHLRESIKSALRRSRVLIVIANREMLAEPRWVKKEVEEFRSSDKVRPVVAISMDGALEDPAIEDAIGAWLPFREYVWLEETREAVDAGIASDQIVDRVAQAPNRITANARWRRAVRIAMTLLVALSIVSTVQSIRASIALGQAERGKADAEHALSIAKAQGDGTLQVILYVLDDLKIALDEVLASESLLPPEDSNRIMHKIAGVAAMPTARYFEELDTRNWPRELRLENASQMIESGSRFRALGRYEEADRLFTMVTDTREELLGSEHPDTAMALIELARNDSEQGEYQLAEQRLTRALNINSVAFGPEDPKTAVCLNNLASIYQQTEQYERAIPVLERSLAVCIKHFGHDDARTATCLSNLGVSQEFLGNYEVAMDYYEDALSISERIAGVDHPDTGVHVNNLGTLLQRMGKTSEAEPFLKRTLAITERQLGPDHPAMAVGYNNLAGNLAFSGKYPEAEEYFSKALNMSISGFGLEHPNTGEIRQSMLGFLYVPWAREVYSKGTGEKTLLEIGKLGLEAIGSRMNLIDPYPLARAQYAECLFYAGRESEAREIAMGLTNDGYCSEGDDPECAAFSRLLSNLELH